MLCDRCGEREATTHDVVISKHGERIEHHLCEVCATGGSTPAEGAGAGLPLGSGVLLSSIIAGQGAVAGAGGAKEARGETARCGSCGLAFGAFKQTGLLGCAECYVAFRDKLGPLIERAHDGATQHVGKIPRRALTQTRSRGVEVEGAAGMAALLGGVRERTARLTTLRRQLQQAVESEQYELAARIRDELDRLSELDMNGEGEGGLS